MALAGVTLAAGEAMGQLDFGHSWSARYGSTAATRVDAGHAVGVLTNGITVSAGDFQGNLNAGGGNGRTKAYTSFVTPSVVVTNREFREVTGNSADVTANALAVASPLVDTRVHAYVGGSYAGTVSFEPPSGLQRTSTGGSKDAYVAKLNRDGTLGLDATLFLATFTGSGTQDCLAIAVGPLAAFGGLQGVGFRYHTAPYQSDTVAVGGYFTTQITFPNSSSFAAIGGEDAYLAILTSGSDQEGHTTDPGGTFLQALRLASNGNDRITAIAYDQADQTITVTGFFSGSMNDTPPIDFDPNRNPGQPGVAPNAYAGGADIFVAKYKFDENDLSQLRLVWRYCTGTAGDDSGAGIALDAAGNAYVTGWKRDAGGKQNIWLAKYDAVNGGSGPAWEYQYGSSGDEAGNGITLDGLDRPVIVGHFGNKRTGGAGLFSLYSLDFDPTAGTDYLNSSGGYDIFLSRFHPDGTYDDTCAFGGTYNDVGAAIAIDPVDTMRVAHAGWFGEPDAPNNYSMDLDPVGNAGPVVCKGKSDGYVSSLLPTFPANVKTQTTLLIDNSGSIDQFEYPLMMDAYRDAIIDTSVVRQDSSAALNAVAFGVTTSSDFVTTDHPALVVMPWTVITPKTAPLFADRLRNLARWDNENFLDESLAVARTSHDTAASLGLDACYHTIGVVCDGRNEPEGTDPGPGAGASVLDTARTLTLGAPYRIDQLNGFGVKPSGTRLFYSDYFKGADVANLGFALETPLDNPPSQRGFFDPSYAPLLERMLSRQTHLPGDFDRDGDVDAVDESRFNAAHGNANDPDHLYSDFDFDGLILGDTDDTTMFQSGYILGNCPQ